MTIYKQHSPVVTLDISDLAPWILFEIRKFEFDYCGKLCDIVYIDEFIHVLGSFEISSYFTNGDRVSRVITEPKSKQEELAGHKAYVEQMVESRRQSLGYKLPAMDDYDKHKYDYLYEEERLAESHALPEPGPMFAHHLPVEEDVERSSDYDYLFEGEDD